MNKKAQVTFFIILGIIIVLLVGLIIYIQNGSFKLGSNIEIQKGVSTSLEVTNIKEYVDNCLQETSKDGLFVIGKQGGYYSIPKTISTILVGENVTYYYSNKKIYIPNISVIQKELGDYISNNLIKCLDFKEFKDKGYNINGKNILVETKINDKNIDVTMNYPITIEKDGISANLNDFNSIINSNIKTLNSVSSKIVNDYSKKPGFVCLTCLKQLAKENNVIIEAATATTISGNNITKFLITDKEYPLNDGNLTLKFVVEQ